jgi:DNA repair protein RadC
LDHPVRRLAELGARAASTLELLAIVLDGGRGQDAADAAAMRLSSTIGPRGGGLRPLGRMTVSELALAGGISARTAARLVAALELGRRAVGEMRPDSDRIESARDVYELLRLRMRDLQQEEFHVLLLDRQGYLLRDVTVTVGTVQETLVHAREVFRPAIAEAAASVILAHNHPSGEPLPSAADRTATRALVSAGALVGIPVDDHVILGEDRYFSFVEARQLPTP